MNRLGYQGQRPAIYQPGATPQVKGFPGIPGLKALPIHRLNLGMLAADRHQMGRAFSPGPGLWGRSWAFGPGWDGTGRWPVGRAPT
jgi:hypothetical protein